MIQVEACKGCGALVYVDSMAGLRIKCDPDPLDAQGASTALFGGREVWTVQKNRDGRPVALQTASPQVMGGLRNPTPSAPVVVRQHKCPPEAAGAPLGPSQPVSGTRTQGAPQNPPVGRTAPSSGPSTGADTVRSAVTLRSDGQPTCDLCRMVIAAGEQHVAIQVGELYVWAQHADQCG